MIYRLQPFESEFVYPLHSIAPRRKIRMKRELISITRTKTRSCHAQEFQREKVDCPSPR